MSAPALNYGLSWTLNFADTRALELAPTLRMLRAVEAAADLGPTYVAYPFRGVIRFDWPHLTLEDVPGPETDPETPRGKLRDRCRRAAAETMLGAPEMRLGAADEATLRGWL